MYRKLIFSLCLVLFSVAIVVAEENGSNGPNGPNASSGSNGPNGLNASSGSNGSGDSEAKTVKGMSVLGNNEAPMSLFIVPWKSSELGVEANLNRTLNERDVPVDRDVFLRELDFYQVSAGSKTTAPAAVSQVVKAR
jgi:hypothetical protein